MVIHGWVGHGERRALAMEWVCPLLEWVCPLLERVCPVLLGVSLQRSLVLHMRRRGLFLEGVGHLRVGGATWRDWGGGRSQRLVEVDGLPAVGTGEKRAESEQQGNNSSGEVGCTCSCKGTLCGGV